MIEGGLPHEFTGLLSSAVDAQKPVDTAERQGLHGVSPRLGGSPVFSLAGLRHSPTN